MLPGESFCAVAPDSHGAEYFQDPGLKNLITYGLYWDL